MTVTHPGDALREIVYHGPSERGWKRLWALMETLDVGAEHAWAMDYALEHLASWPDALRELPARALNAALEGQEVPLWPLARKVRLTGAKTPALKRLCGLAQMSTITSLGLEKCKLGPKAGIGALAKARHLGGVRELALEDCVIGDDGLAALLQTPLLGQLKSLALVPRCFSAPKKLNLSYRAIDLLGEATHLSALEHLTLRHGFEAPRSMGLTDQYEDWRDNFERLFHSPLLQSLSSLKLIDITPLPEYIQSTRFERLRRLDLRDCFLKSSQLQALLACPWVAGLESLAFSVEQTGAHYSYSDVLKRDAFEALCKHDGLTGLRALTLHIGGLNLEETLLQAPWVRQLKTLRLEGRFSDANVQSLATSAALVGLERLELEQQFEKPGLHSSPQWRQENMPGQAAALAWLLAQNRPALKSIETNLSFFTTEETGAVLSKAHQSQDGQSPYPAWGHWVGALERAGVLEAGPSEPELLDASRTTTIDFTYDEAQLAQKLQRLLDEGELGRVGSLSLYPNLEMAPLEVWLAVASAAMPNLRELTLHFWGWQWGEEDRATRVLRAVADNTSLGALGKLALKGGVSLPSSIEGFLLLKASAHIDKSVRDAMVIQERYGSILNNIHTQERMFRAFFGCPALATQRELDLSKIKLGNIGAIHLAHCGHLSSLETLVLRHCAIGTSGAKALAASAHLAGLKKLDLGHNRNIGPEGVEALALSTTLSPQITKLWAKKLKKLQKTK